jgi:phage tail-like protein
MRLRVPALPPGSRLAVRTRTRADASSLSVLTGDAALGNAASWQQSPIIVADPQPDPAQKPKPNTEPDPIELLVLSRPGQFLQLQIEMWGDGVRTPVIESVRLTAPRDSWVQYLPAIFSQPEEQRIFLDRYLSTAQATWNRVEDALGSFARFLDPRSVPADQLAYLAGWLDLQLEGSLKPDQNRQILAMLPHIRREWGTVEGMRKWIRVHLAVLSGLDINVLERSDLPGIVERFVERRRFLLGRDDLSRLSGDEPLWSPAVERRFQLDVFDQEGEVELVSTGEPDLDLFRRYAHSFRVFIPASWVRTAATEALLRRAIDLQRPAHTIFDLVLVEPRFAIGFQSTLDLDAVVGGDERWQLASDREPVREGRAPYSRLGFDTTIHGSYLGCLGSDGRLA